MFDVSTSTVFALLATKALHGHKLGRRTLLNVQEVAAYFASLPIADVSYPSHARGASGPAAA